MTSRAQRKKGGAPAPRAPEKTSASKMIDTERRLCEDRRALEAHARVLNESIEASSEAATSRLAERLAPMKQRLRDLLVPARAMDMAIQRAEDERAGLAVAEGLPTVLDAIADAAPFGSAYEPGVEWTDADPDAIERAAVDLFDDLHRQCESLDAAIKKAEAAAQAAYGKLANAVRDAQIPACMNAALLCAQKVRNLTAARLGRPLPFARLGTAMEVHEAALKALSTLPNLTDLAVAAIDAIDIVPPPATFGSNADPDDLIPD